MYDAWIMGIIIPVNPCDLVAKSDGSWIAKVCGSPVDDGVVTTLHVEVSFPSRNRRDVWRRLVQDWSQSMLRPSRAA